MTSLRALTERRATLLRTSADLFAELDKAGRVMTAEEIGAEDARVAELNEIDASIQRSQAHADRLRAAPGAGGQNTGTAPEGGFSSLGEQLMAIAVAGGKNNPQRDPRLQFVDSKGILGAGPLAAMRGVSAGPTGLGEAVDADGGYLVQQQFMSEMLTPIFTGGEVIRRVRRIGIGAEFNGIRMNGIDETSRANGSRWGGVRVYWTNEASLINASQPKFKQIQMELEKVTGLYYATSELLRDTSALTSWLTQAFTDEFTFKLEDGIINGIGGGSPLGLLTSGAVITVPKEGSQAAATIVAENIMKMWTRMPARLRRNAVWLINQEVEPQLFQLNIKVKNVAGTENVGGFPSPEVMYVPPGVNGNEYGTLMGRPVVPVEYCAALGTAGDIIFADLSQYLAIDKGGIEQQTSLHVRFLYDEQAFRFILRFNGQPLWSSAVTPYKGTATVSPFVVLENR